MNSLSPCLQTRLARRGLLDFAVFMFVASNVVVGQSAFQNLDFESAVLDPVPQWPVSFAPAQQAFPGWSVAIGGVVQTQVLQNNETLGAPSVDIFGPSYPTTGIIEGNYTAALQAGYTPETSFRSASLSQTGLVPEGTKSITLKAVLAGNFSITLEDQRIPLVRRGDGTNYAIFSGEVSSFAGRVCRLMLIALPFGLPATPNLVDSISFSPLTTELSTVDIKDSGTNSLLFSWPSTPNTVVLQQNDSLAPFGWRNLTNVAGGFGPRSFVNLPKSTNSAFYRLAWQPLSRRK
jgi:hypothetical protein